MMHVIVARNASFKSPNNIDSLELEASFSILRNDLFEWILVLPKILHAIH
jgi:hypothetical protein